MIVCVYVLVSCLFWLFLLSACLLIFVTLYFVFYARISFFFSLYFINYVLFYSFSYYFSPLFACFLSFTYVYFSHSKNHVYFSLFDKQNDCQLHVYLVRIFLFIVFVFCRMFCILICMEETEFIFVFVLHVVLFVRLVCPLLSIACLLYLCMPHVRCLS